MYRYVAVAVLLLFSTAGQAQQAAPAEKPELNFCTGGKSGNYYWAAQQIAQFLVNTFKVNIFETKGTLNNLRDLVDGKCDIGFGQSDVGEQFRIETPGAADSLELLSKVYNEAVHVLCPASVKWATLTEMAKTKGTRKMIVGGDGSGTAETWRILRQADDDLYKPIERDPSPPDYASAHAVASSTSTCMLWVSGLNSADMVSANALSGRGKGGKKTLKLISVDDRRFFDLKGHDGQPIYTLKTIEPRKAAGNEPGMYDNLINNGGMFSSASIDVLIVPAQLMITKTYKEKIGRQKLASLLQAIDDAQPTIWAKVDPTETN